MLKLLDRFYGDLQIVNCALRAIDQVSPKSLREDSEFWEYALERVYRRGKEDMDDLNEALRLGHTCPMQQRSAMDEMNRLLKELEKKLKASKL